MRMTHDEMIAVIQAHRDGKAIQSWSDYPGKVGWYDCKEPSWSFFEVCYRIKPEPREIWLNQYPSGLNGSGIHATKRLAELSATIPGVKQIRFIEAIEGGES